MSKKIIYLLSLLMALSLVFASCKKNSLTPGDIGGKVEEGDNSQNAGDDGLYDEFGKITNDTYITKEIVLQFSGAQGYRNPVGVVMGEKSNYVLIISELRYAKTGADNDIALDGETSTDIYAVLSTKAGKKDSFQTKAFVGRDDSAGGITAATSHAAPVVFKLSTNQVVVVASSGVGISRIGKTYTERGGGSGIQYSIVTIKETGVGEPTIVSTKWEDVKINGGSSTTIADKIKELSTSEKGWVDPTGEVFAQFGTHSARGFVDGTKLVLPVVVANQGKRGATTEYMGNLILTVDVTDAASGNVSTISGWSVASYTAFNQKSGTQVSIQKESIIIGKKGDNYKYIAVPNGQANHYLTLGDAAVSSSKNNAPSEPNSGIGAWDGSLGYLTLKWVGSAQYDPADYANAKGTEKSLLMHVKDHESNPTIYLVNKNGMTVSGNGWTVFNGAGKASSVDVLGDGTVITVAEEGGGSDRHFDVVFSRYSQAYLASKGLK